MTKRRQFFVALMCVVAGVLLGQFVSHTLFFTSNVVGDSMNPTYEEGDRVGVFMLESPERGDVIVVDEGDKYVIKRCVGMPGDTLQIKDGKLYINGSIYKEDYVLEPGLVYDPGIAALPVSLGNDEYFMLGDNREVSKDSRQVGIITKSQIVGVVLR